MKEKNVLPYDGEAAFIRDISADLDWAAVTRTLIEHIPWRVETARLFGREMVVPRMTAWFGDAAYSGILHQPAPLPAIVHSLRERAEALSGASFNSVLPMVCTLESRGRKAKWPLRIERSLPYSGRALPSYMNVMAFGPPSAAVQMPTARPFRSPLKVLPRTARLFGINIAARCPA